MKIKNLLINYKIFSKPIVEGPITLNELISYGRPLWNSFYQKEEKNYTKLTSFIYTKLYGSPSLNEETKMILSFGIRLSLELLSTETIETLIAHSLAYCSFVSQDRCTIKCKFLSEPVVAEVAKIFFKNKGSYLQAFQTLKQHFLINHLNIGDIGETVSQLIFLRVFDSLVGKATYFNEFDQVSVKLEDFLQYFWPEVALNEFPKSAKNYCLFFNHFIELEEQITIEILTKALRRCCALKLIKNCKGADLAIPLFDIRQGFGTEVSGILWIQIKSKKVDTPQNIKTSLSKKLCTDYILGKKLDDSNESNSNINISDDIKKLPSFGIHFTLVADVTKPLYFSDENYVLQTINSYLSKKKKENIENINAATVECLRHVCPKLGIINYKKMQKRQLVNEISASINDPTCHNMEYYKMFSDSKQIYNCCCFLKAANKLEQLFLGDEWLALVDILSVCKQTSTRNTTFDREASVKSYLELHKEEVMRLEQLDLKMS